ncbi:hypothetical protein ACGFX8_35360, partial [Streptomyces sp. NPDC048362]
SRRHLHEDNTQARTGTAPRAMASFRNPAISTTRLAGRANIAHARRDLLDHNDAFAVYDIYSTTPKPDTTTQRRGRAYWRTL